MRELGRWMPTTWTMQAFNDLMIRGQPPSATNGDIRPFGYMSNLNQRSKHTLYYWSCYRDSVTNRKLTTAVYISTMILVGSMCVGACAVFVPVDTGPPPAEVSRTTTTTQTSVPNPSTTTQKTTVTQTRGN